MFGFPCNSNLYIGKQFAHVHAICVVSCCFLCTRQRLNQLENVIFPTFFLLFRFQFFFETCTGCFNSAPQTFRIHSNLFCIYFFRNDLWTWKFQRALIFVVIVVVVNIIIIIISIKNKNNKTSAINLIPHNATRIPGARSEINDGENVCVCVYACEQRNAFIRTDPKIRAEKEQMIAAMWRMRRRRWLHRRWRRRRRH